MIIKVLSGTGKIPVKSNKEDSAYDIFAVSDPEIVGEKTDLFGKFFYNIDYIQYRTGLFIEPDKKWGIIVSPRSSNSKFNLLLANSIGTIDNPYRGEILIRYKYVFQPEDLSIQDGKIVGRINLDKIYKKGDRVAQMKVEKVTDIDFIIVNKLSETERGNGGHGSTGK